jgi:hypothetical protein
MNYSMLLMVAVAAAGAGCSNGHHEAADGNTPMASPDQGAPWVKNAIPGCERVTDDEMLVVLGQPVTGREEGGYYGWTTESNRVDVRVFPDASLPADSVTKARRPCLTVNRRTADCTNSRGSATRRSPGLHRSRGTVTITLGYPGGQSPSCAPRGQSP